MIDSGVGLKNPLFFVGAVEDNVDPRLEGRVRVRAFGVHGTPDEVPRDLLPWAIVAKGDYDPNGSPGSGLPAVNSWVFGVFLDGRDCQVPLVLGLIPTQFMDPVTPETIREQGWGYIPPKDAEILARGSAPEDIGEPQNDRLSRGERLEETYVLSQETGRALGVKIGGTDTTWDEPGSAYGAQYPYNRVIKTKSHSIELDDTPGAERIMIHHSSGSFIQIDSRGTTTEKTVSDKYEVVDRKQHVVIGGMSTVTILGNSYVYVKGNKVEEIEGDLKTLVHGNHLLSVGGQSSIVASEQFQARGADLKLEANVGTMAVKAGKELQIQAGNFGAPYGAISVKAEKILVDATDKLHLRGNTQVNIQAIGELNASAVTINQFAGTDFNVQSLGTSKLSSGLSTDISGGISLAIGAGASTFIKAPFVYIDDFINMANGVALPPDPAIIAPQFLIPPVGQKPFVPGSATPEVAWGAAAVVAPEPVAKSTSIVPPDIPGSMGSAGYGAKDHRGESNAPVGSGAVATPNVPITAALQSSLAPLLDFIGNKESKGYDDISGLVSRSRYPDKPLTRMTIKEVLDWQQSIDSFQLSEAAGRYQIMEDTLRGYDNDRTTSGGKSLYERAGLSSGDLFSPENQDKMAIVLLEGRGIKKFLNGEITREQFANNLANEWASLPMVSGPNAGRSVYAGDRAGNRALTTVQEFLNAIDAVAREYKAANENFSLNPNNGGPR